MNKLKVMEENTTASMSQIQDADIAKLAMDLMKNQILTQSQQAITSQAKQARERVLELWT